MEMIMDDYVPEGSATQVKIKEIVEISDQLWSSSKFIKVEQKLSQYKVYWRS